MQIGRAAVGAVMMLAVAGCGAGEDPAPAGDPAVTIPASTDTVFAHAVSRISPDALDSGTIIEFGQTAELFTLAESDQRWLSATAIGNLLVADESNAQAIGVDAKTADYSIEVGVFPTRVGVVAGGQDPDAITDAAKASGYQGDDVLTQSFDAAAPVTVSVQQIKPLDEDVVLATTDADVGWVDGGSLFADEVVGPIAVCLGDVLGAMIVEVDNGTVGIGVRAEGVDIVSVLCLPGGDDAAKDAEDDLAAPAFADRLEVIDTEVEDGLAKVTVQHVGGAHAMLLFQALAQNQLPG